MESNGKKFRTETLLYENGIIWFTGVFDNKLYRYELVGRQMTLFYTFEYEDQDGERLFGSLAKKENLLFCVPFSASALYVIDVLTKRVKRREIKQPKSWEYEDYVPVAKFSSSVLYGSSLFLVGTTYPAIIQYNYIEDNITYHSEWFKELQTRFTSYRDFIFKKICTDGNLFFAPCCRSSCVLEFDMESLAYKICDLHTSITGFNAICKNRNKFWLLPRTDERVVCWNGRDSLVNEYVFLKNEKRQVNFYNDVFEVDEEHIILLAGSARDSLYLDTRKNEAQILSGRMQGQSSFLYLGREGNCFYAFGTYLGRLVLFKDQRVFFKKIDLSAADSAVVGRDDLFIRSENYYDNLDDFMAETGAAENLALGRKNAALHGKAIWENISALP